MDIESITILNVPIHCISWDKTLEILYSKLDSSSHHPFIVFTPNPEIIVEAQRDASFLEIMQSADLLLPDGQGIIWASQGKIRQRVTGSDIMQNLLFYANRHELSVGYVIRPDGLSSSEDIIQTMNNSYPNCRTIITTDTFNDDALDIVFVSLGFPTQEQWVKRNVKYLSNSKIILTVGAGVDFLTGKQIRAPFIFRKIGLEWLWRLILQPNRIKRIFTATIIFPIYIIKARLKKTHD